MTKQSVREQVSQAIGAMTFEERLVADAHVASEVTRLPFWPDARTIFAFVSMDDEVELTAILNAALRGNKRIALPRLTEDKPPIMEFRVVEAGPGERATWADLVTALERHSYGFLQPSAGETVIPGSGDVVLVPARAFDRLGNRVGRGGGYYDALLSTISPSVQTVGIGYGCQVFPAVPVDKHDRRVQIVVTDSETSFCLRI